MLRNTRRIPKKVLLILIYIGLIPLHGHYSPEIKNHQDHHCLPGVVMSSKHLRTVTEGLLSLICPFVLGLRSALWVRRQPRRAVMRWFANVVVFRMDSRHRARTLVWSG